MALIPGPESESWLVLFTLTGTGKKFTARHSTHA